MDAVLGKIVYWTAVVAISLALVVLLILFFESRDESQIESGSSPVAPLVLPGA
jgi:hypothetical protein